MNIKELSDKELEELYHSVVTERCKRLHKLVTREVYVGGNYGTTGKYNNGLPK